MPFIGNPDDLLSVQECAACKNIHKNTVWNKIRNGELPAVRIGARIVRVKRSDLDALFTPYVGGEFGRWAK
jgi:excisionase family DNA binding protein